MDRGARQLREAAASLVAECGPYATLAALFLAGEAQEAGQADEAADWVRVAALIPARDGPPRPRFIVLPVVVGRA